MYDVPIKYNFRVMAHKAAIVKIINLYSKHWENKLQALVTSNGMSHRVVPYIIMYTMNGGIQIFPCITTYRDEICE